MSDLHGVKIGLEIHQRLDTNKLFCSCPSKIIENKEGEVKITRQLHPVLSELGEIDRAALVEFEKRKTFEYWCYNDSNCLVETDEEPPHSMNEDALSIGFEAAMQMNAKPVEEVHCMRKIVIDGSNTSGFQRTAIIAMNGSIETSQGNIAITQVALEEESAGIVNASDDMAVYRLDRLGIPLIEISTAPDIKNPAHAMEAAEKIGLILRATGKVARGIGTIRQDVNVSIKGGARVEIKGAQELKMISLLVENEIRRQKELIKILGELRKSNNGMKFTSEPKDLTQIFKQTESKLIIAGMQKNEEVWGMAVRKHAGLLGREINLGRRYGTELSDYAKLGGVKGIIHSDEALEKYGFGDKEIMQLRQQFGLAGEDAWIIVIAKKETAEKALRKVRERVEMDFIPEETRKANSDGTSSYMRPLPGSARLYPETDVAPIELDIARLKLIKKHMGESLEAKREKLERLLGNEMAEKMLRSPRLALFEKLVEHGIDATVVANTLENTVIALRREGIDVREESIVKVLHGYVQGRWVKAAIIELLREIGRGKTLDQAAVEKNLYKVTEEDLKRIAHENAYDFAKIMQRYRLQIESSELEKLIKKQKK